MNDYVRLTPLHIDDVMAYKREREKKKTYINQRSRNRSKEKKGRTVLCLSAAIAMEEEVGTACCCPPLSQRRQRRQHDAHSVDGAREELLGLCALSPSTAAITDGWSLIDLLL